MSSISYVWNLTNNYFQTYEESWGPRGGGVHRISRDGDNRMGEKNNPPKSLGPPPNPKKCHAEFPSLKNFQKALCHLI